MAGMLAQRCLARLTSALSTPLASPLVARTALAPSSLWAQFVRFRKVKGHATERDVAEGRATKAERAGNDAADRLAVAGAARHAAPRALVFRTLAEDRRVSRQQAFMAELWREVGHRYAELEKEEAAGAGGGGGAGAVEADYPFEPVGAEAAELVAIPPAPWPG